MSLGPLTEDSRAPRVAGALALVLAPVLLIVGGLLHPSEKDDAAAQMVVIRDQLDRWYFSHLLLILGFALLLPALVTAARPLRARFGALYATTTALVGIGLLFEICGIAMDGFGLWLLAHTSSTGVADALAEESDDLSSLHFLFTYLPLGLGLGLLLLGVGLLRARGLSVWKVAVLMVAGVASMVQLLTELSPALVVAFLALAVALVPTGLQAFGRVETLAPTSPAPRVYSR
jgi:hypothetical protein